MSNISKTQKNLKKKLSLDDYMHLDEQESRDVVVSNAGESSETDHARETSSAKQTEQSAGSKIKATYYLTEDDHSALTHIYIKRLQNKQKTDRSALIGEAIRLLYDKEIA